MALCASIAVLFCVFTSVYRFNTLGGRFGGFDNDHFVPFAYAKQVQAGEQPLRDFEGLGLQGAWPSLTYETSALAQQWLGDNLRSEALLTVAGVGLAASLTFVAAASVASVPWAALATLVSVFVAPTLYNYPKVLLLSAAALVIVTYGRRPHRAGPVAGAVVTAVAFLFRHDLAAYVGVGMLLACVAATRGPDRLRHTTLYVATTILLLTPSLLFVQRYEGLVQYVRDGLALSAREAERTDLPGWPAFTRRDEAGDITTVARFLDVEENGVTWLYYLTRLLPVGVVALALTRRTEPFDARAAMLAIAGMAAFAAPFLVRGNIAVRLGDIGPLVAVLGAGVCHELVRRCSGQTRWGRTACAIPLLLLAVGTARATASVGVVWGQLGTAGFRHSWSVTRQQSEQLWAQLATLPASAVAVPTDGPLTVSHYINRCTAPTDRVVMMTYEPELLPFAGRLFGAGRLSILPDYALDSRQERSLVSRWQQQSVPLAFVEFEEFWNPAGTTAPIVRAHLHARYAPVGSMPLGGDRVLRVFAERTRQATSTFGPDALPCFQAVSEP